MALYPGTRSDMYMRLFATFVSVSDHAQKNLGDSTHLIGSTRSMQMIIKLFAEAYGMT